MRLPYETAVLIVAAALVTYELIISRSEVADDIENLAILVATSSVSAIEFNDPIAGKVILRALQSCESILRETISCPDGRYSRRSMESKTLPIGEGESLSSGRSQTYQGGRR